MADRAWDSGESVEERALRGALDRAEVLSDLGRHEEAIALLSPLLGGSPDDTELLSDLGREHLNVGGRRHHRTGVDLLRRAVALQPDDPSLLALLGYALSISPTRWDESRGLLDRAAALAPLDPHVALVRGQAIERMSLVRYGDALAAADRAVELAPRDVDALLLRATVLQQKYNPLRDSEKEQAREAILEVLRADPGNAQAAFLLAKVETPLSNAAEAAGFHEAVRRDPHHLEAITRVDSALVAPLRGGYWMLWLLTGLQAVLLAHDVDWGTGLSIAVVVLVLAVPWWRFSATRRRSPQGFGSRESGFDWWLLVFGVFLYLGVAAFRASTHAILGGGALGATVVLLLLAGVAYRIRAARRRRRYRG